MVWVKLLKLLENFNAYLTTISYRYECWRKLKIIDKMIYGEIKASNKEVLSIFTISNQHLGITIISSSTTIEKVSDDIT